ncbi:hypothetical protein Tco_1540721, partial [Tanacetum coccineum]
KMRKAVEELFVLTDKYKEMEKELADSGTAEFKRNNSPMKYYTRYIIYEETRKCSPQLITQVESLEHVPHTDIVMLLSIDELSNEARAAKRLKSFLVENFGNKTNKELFDFIWMNKRNVGSLEHNLPEKAVAIKEAIKCHEAKIERTVRLQRPKVRLLISLFL